MFCTTSMTTMLFCTTETSNFLVTNYFYGGIVVCAYRIFFSWVHVRFYFYFTPAHFLLAGRWHFSFSHCRYEIFRFFFQRNSSPLFWITRSSSFSVIHVSVNITNNVEKDTTLFFFLSKSPGGHEISFQIKPWVLFGFIPVDWVILYWCACVRTDGRLGGRADVRSRDDQNFSYA